MRDFVGQTRRQCLSPLPVRTGVCNAVGKFGQPRVAVPRFAIGKLTGTQFSGGATVASLQPGQAVRVNLAGIAGREASCSMRP